MLPGFAGGETWENTAVAKIQREKRQIKAGPGGGRLPGLVSGAKEEGCRIHPQKHRCCCPTRAQHPHTPRCPRAWGWAWSEEQTLGPQPLRPSGERWSRPV